MIYKWSYIDACFECYSLNLNTTELDKSPPSIDEFGNKKILISVVCRDCGEEWEDEVEIT